MKEIFFNLRSEESGQDLVEYALVVSLVGLGAAASLKALLANIGTAFASVGAVLPTRH